MMEFLTYDAKAAPVFTESAVVATEVPAQELVPLVEPAVPWWPTALTVDRGTSYGAYTHMQSLLWQIYEEVRAEKAHEAYGKALSELSEEELQNIYKMIPMSIFEAGPKG